MPDAPEDLSRAVIAEAIRMLWKAGRNATLAVERAQVICATRELESEGRRRWEVIVQLLETCRDTGKIPTSIHNLTRAET